MKRFNNKRQGVALVTTVIMLSIVTIMAIAFLGVTRRERASVIASTELTVSRQMAKMGSERAVAEVVSRMIRDNSLQSIDFIVSTNYQNPFGFQSGIANAGNVNYFFKRDGSALNGADQIQNIANLQIDPRPPVFFESIQNRRAVQEFRFFLDLNRNRAFEDSGLIRLSENGQITDNFQQLSGDPQWIGVLENPDLPHSATNRFVGRYLFYALPTGRSLDLNFIHNQSKIARLNGDPNSEGYYRNDGVGAWEINLAGFLRELNPNIWDYSYNTNLASASAGRAFSDALDLTLHKYFRLNQANPGNSTFGYQSLLTPVEFFALSQNKPGVINAFQTDGVDSYGDALILPDPLGNDEENPTTTKWAGSGPPRQYFDPQELFVAGRPYSLTSTDSLRGGFAYRMTASMTNLLNNNTVNRYTFYKMLGQLGVDSLPAHRERLNLNYDNRSELSYSVTLPPGDTRFKTSEFLHWDPAVLYMEMADRVLKQRFGHINSSISITNINVFPNGEYGAEVHQVLQMCANIVDSNHHGPASELRKAASPNGGFFSFPMVFKPVFQVGLSNTVTIVNWLLLGEDGYRAVTDEPWFDLTKATDINRFASNPNPRANIYGVPYVVAARQGIPTFNEILFETHATVTRKVQAIKRSPFDALDKPKIVEQAHFLSLSNNVGYEVWNSYRRSFPFEVSMLATNNLEYGLFNQGGLLRGDNFIASTAQNIPSDGFAPSTDSTFSSTANGDSSFTIPISGSYQIVTNEQYVADSLILTNKTIFERDLTPLQLDLALTNRMTYLMFDQATGHILDFVNLQPMTNYYRLSDALASQSGSNGDGRFWLTNTVDSIFSATPITQGMENQILASMGSLSVQEWNSFSQDPIQGRDKEDSIAAFSEFMTGVTTYPRAVPRTPPSLQQTPFNPTRKFKWQTVLQANDPLVHYTLADLSDPLQPPSRPIQVPLSMINSPSMTNNNLGKLNDRYRPWGGSPSVSTLSTVANQQSNPAIKDPGVTEPSLHNFIRNNETRGHKFATLGTLGAIHRGTPWQTVYMKSHGQGDDFVTPEEWNQWSGHSTRNFTHPTNDWNMFSLFTTAMSDNATRGLLSVNQTNSAAWAGVLSGIKLKTSPSLPVEDAVITPVTPEFNTLVAGINQGRQVFPTFNQGGRNLYPYQGGILAAPELSILSPYITGEPSEDLVEAIPRKIMSLVKDDDPRVVVYAYGQTLKPAPRSVVGTANQFNGLVTNYVPTSEFVTKTLIQFFNDAGGTLRYRAEEFSIIDPAE